MRNMRNNQTTLWPVLAYFYASKNREDTTFGKKEYQKQYRLPKYLYIWAAYFYRPGNLCSGSDTSVPVTLDPDPTFKEFSRDQDPHS
jgi:hypothetical protein